MTVASMDAGHEPPRDGLRRVIANHPQIMSRYYRQGIASGGLKPHALRDYPLPIVATFVLFDCNPASYPIRQGSLRAWGFNRQWALPIG